MPLLFPFAINPRAQCLCERDGAVSVHRMGQHYRPAVPLTAVVKTSRLVCGHSSRCPADILNKQFWFSRGPSHRDRQRRGRGGWDDAGW
jgi:hypothetical protein